MNQFLRGIHQDLSDSDILWGLTDRSTQEEICEKAFQIMTERQYMTVSTVNDGHPESRVIDLQRLKDGRVMFITSRRKPFYQQLLKCPEVVACLPIDSWYMLRVRAFVKEVSDDQTIRDEYFASNPGTKRMYRNNLSVVAFFLLEKGEGGVVPPIRQRAGPQGAFRLWRLCAPAADLLDYRAVCRLRYLSAKLCRTGHFPGRGWKISYPPYGL